MTTEHQKGDAMLASFATLSILQLIKDAQQKHGLRHGDYQRYRFVIYFYFNLPGKCNFMLLIFNHKVVEYKQILADKLLSVSTVVSG